MKHFPDNQLGNDRVITESTIFGDIDIGVSSTSPLATLFPDLYAFDAPFLFLSPEDAYAKLDGETGQAILKTLEKKGLKGLAFWGKTASGTSPTAKKLLPSLPIWTA